MCQQGTAKSKGGILPGLDEEHHCQRQGRRGRLIWQSRSKQIVTYLGLGLIKEGRAPPLQPGKGLGALCKLMNLSLDQKILASGSLAKLKL